MSDPTKVFDRSHDFFRSQSNPLDPFFHPKNIAVIGATEKAGSVGRTMAVNLSKNSFGGTLYHINPNHPSVLDIKAYPNIAAATRFLSIPRKTI